MENKPESYKNTKETVNIKDVANPVKIIGGKLVEVDKVTGKPIKK